MHTDTEYQAKYHQLYEAARGVLDWWYESHGVVDDAHLPWQLKNLQHWVESDEIQPSRNPQKKA